MTATVPPRATPSPPAEHRLGLAHQVNPAAAGRRFVRERLTGRVPPEVVDLAELLTSELITNAVLYAPPPVEVTVHLDPHRVLVAVHDSSTRVPRRRVLRAGGEQGYGLFMLDRLTAAWGCKVHGTGKRVWCYLPVPPA